MRLRVLTCDEVDAAGLAGPLDRLLAASETEPEAVELGWTETYDELRGRFPDVVWALLEVAGELVALSCADPQDGADWVLVYTGVSPPHRRRGLGRAVKQSLHAAIAARGPGRSRRRTTRATWRCSVSTPSSATSPTRSASGCVASRRRR